MKNLRVKSVRIVGVLPSFPFQRAKSLVLELHRSMPSRFPPPEIEGLLELEWFERLTEWRRVSGSDFWRLKRPVAVFLDEKLIGSDIELLKMTSLGNIFVEFVPRRDTSLMMSRFRMDYLARLRDTKLIHCYFDICVDDAFIGTLVFQLYSDILPKTCENFTTLCLGKRGSFFSYKGSRIHRIVKNGWLQGGDIQYGTGGGGYSIYCSPLEDECYGVSHDRRGVLSMANDGRHTNGSQFFITLSPSTWMDKYYVAFGQLIEGVRVLKQVENVETFRECPLKRIEIKNCGKLNLQDVDDVDFMYEPDMSDARVKKKPVLESIADQVARLIMEAVTECLAIKEHVPDVIHSGDVPSAMSLDMFFQGFYSLPTEVLEDSAKYIRTHRRQFLRNFRPIATEVVEVIAYDLLTAVFTKLVDLDDVREALTHPMYKNLLDGINMKVEMAEKPYVKVFVDQLTTAAETILKVLTRKLTWMRRKSQKMLAFQDQMNEWVQSFTLQETFVDDNFRLTDRPPYVAPSNRGPFETPKNVPQRKVPPKDEDADPCAEKKENKRKRIGKEPTAVEICCDGKPPSKDDPVVADFFSSCFYELKTATRNRGGRFSILDLIEQGRHQLKVLRHHEKRSRTKARICLDKRINRWMKDVEYTSETDWIRQTVFSRDDVCLNHTEEIMYGAMTIGLLEIYFLMESHLKRSRKKYITRVLYPEDKSASHLKEEEEQLQQQEQEEKGESPCSSESEIDRPQTAKSKGRRSLGGEWKKHGKPCQCGDVCCDCTSEPGGRREVSVVVPPTPPTPPPSMKTSDAGAVPEFGEVCSCYSGPEEVDVDELLAQVMGESGQRVSVKSFRWMQSYIEEKGCQFKSEFAGKVHDWLETEVFSYRGFLSKHSLVTRASMLSFSLSIASLIKEENELKSELKDFVFDLWELYFKEMMKETKLENPPESVGGEVVAESETERESVCEDPCSRVKSLVKDDFDFDKFCQENARKQEEEEAIQLPLDVEQDAESPAEETAATLDMDVGKEDDILDQKPIEVKKKVVTEEEEKEVEEEGATVVKEDVKVEVKGEVKPEAKPEVKDELPTETKATVDQAFPKVIKELIVSSEEIRLSSPYTLPFWVSFLTEITKRALGLMAKSSRLPRRLYFTTDSQISFDDKIKEWMEFNNFSAPVIGGKDIRDFIASHHVELENLDETARSFLRKKRIAQLMEKSSRSSTAMIVAEELIYDVHMRSFEKIAETTGNVPVDILNDLIAAATIEAAEIPQDGQEPGEVFDTEAETELPGE